VSWYSGILFVDCAKKAKAKRYEDFALKLYTPFWSKFTGWALILCSGGFTVIYIVFVKEMFPYII